MISGALLPALFVIPACALLMLMIAVHLHRVVHRPDLPPSRRRIRIANTLVMLTVVPFLAVGLSLIDPDVQPRRLAFVWSTTIALLSMSVLLAVLDVVNTVRIFRRRRQVLRARLREVGARRTPGEEETG
ncbi:MAG: hypothetical protein KDA21_06825 [Phycisphaerales bacterium]|nr:hypothetical protein [Phycisphaerales bacterium]